MFRLLTLLTLSKQRHSLLVEFGIKLEDVISENQDTKTLKGVQDETVMPPIRLCG